MRRIYEPNRDTSKYRSLVDARRIREIFTDRPAERMREMRWRWPSVMQEVGTCEAVMYASDKWKEGRGRDWFEDYKHISEGPQWVLAREGFLVEDGRPQQEIDVCGPMIRMGQMPDSFADLADVLGVQVRLYEDVDTDDGYQIPNGKDDGYYEVRISKAKLGAGKFPDSDDTFLLVYTPAGVELIIVGEKLRIEKDGITG